RGADLILVPTANLEGEPLDLFAWEMRVAAFQNSVYIAMCNRVGVEGEAVWGGHSMMSDPEGRLIAEAGDEETLKLARYELDFVRRKRRENKFLPLYRAESFDLA
ncbi:MAG: carbon-nitrogen hydrolase family protein, partial [Desulfuromonadales bacterium]|nr:carbon-nitrogen hydrolase family protein [Desulfuromonadales bacterium]NIS39621.1 carbon-nitrogen hydrolase family protein [Desulfuromonadales bacterium]